MLSIEQLAVSTMIGSSPHMGEPNLKLYCNRPSNVYTFDSVGNRQPVSIIEILQLSVRESKAQRMIDLKGGMAKLVYLVGRLIVPKLIPDWLNLKSKHKAELIYPSKLIAGQFEFDGTPTHRIADYNVVRGDFIKGTFTEVM